MWSKESHASAYRSLDCSVRCCPLLPWGYQAQWSARDLLSPWEIEAGECGASAAGYWCKADTAEEAKAAARAEFEAWKEEQARKWEAADLTGWEIPR